MPDLAVPDLNGLDLVDPQSYARGGYPHDTWSRLRRDAPLRRFDPPGFLPFWAVTKHADICEISRQPEQFLNGPGMTIVTDEMAAAAAQRGRNSLQGMRTIINMDQPEHRVYRRVASPYFTRNALRRGNLEAQIALSARSLVDKLEARGARNECDFVSEVANLHPLRIISQILGVPEEDEPLILKLTNELFGNEDPEFQRSGDRRERIAALGADLYQYFARVISDRRANPRDDLASVLANAKIDGEPMGEIETFGYYLIAFTAGHETTRGAIGGGMLALIEHPEEREKLRRDPSLIPTAVNEILRWVTPVNTMVRTAVDDYELRDQKIRAGDKLVLFYASANRDEEVFEDPLGFRVDRSPNPHLGFGIGEHFCLGANLARKTTGGLFAELIPRLESVELAGLPERVASNLVPGIKHLPIRYRITPAL